MLALREISKPEVRPLNMEALRGSSWLFLINGCGHIMCSAVKALADHDRSSAIRNKQDKEKETLLVVG